ncbi:hypothetical protein TPA0910_15700 [Streptomyces hygroscopicus subsp. sporocinereus]|uniref:Uncharacterized protein n=1 Tax=Streptomyces hygroscopicus TaxID=1912 RepID=A0ABQ3TUX1_STRHY|nr:hypothetical protein TPA0910_15700 [Streptomyces hygroscopicus]
MRAGHGRMTIRVSRDSGQTFEPTKVYDTATDELEPLLSDAWPPCECARCDLAVEQRLRREIERLTAEGVPRAQAVRDRLARP